MATITSFDEVLSYLGEESQTSTNTLERFKLVHRLAERAVRRYVGTNLIQADYTHYLPRATRFDSRPHMGEILRLPEYPVRSITSIYEDTGAYAGQATDAFPDSSLLTAGDDYYLAVDDSGLSWFGHVVRLGANWPSTGGSLKVTYTAGWSADELDGDVDNMRLDASDIKLAILKTISDNILRRDQQTGDGGPVKTESIEDWKVTYVMHESSKRDENDIGSVVLPLDAQRLMSPFRRPMAV